MKVIKIWHDDVRPPPSSEWVWAPNNDVAKDLFKQYRVEEISMDHDLGARPEDGMLARGQSEDNGAVLAKWMVENLSQLPEKITIHSWNPGGAARMADILADAGASVLISPYSS